MSRAALINQIEQTPSDRQKLLSLLQSAPVERDRFVSHLYQSRRECRLESLDHFELAIARCIIL
jgi:hypothetical protein